MFRTNPKLRPENLGYIKSPRVRGAPIRNDPKFGQASIRLPPKSLQAWPRTRSAADRRAKVECQGAHWLVSQARCSEGLSPSVQQAVGGCIWLQAHDRGLLGEVPTVETGLENSDAPKAIAPGTLMTGAHSPWPLFCNDLDQAQQWVSDQLRRTPTDKELGHQALSLGLTDTVRTSSIEAI